MAGLLDFQNPDTLSQLGLLGGLLTARQGQNWPLMLQQAAQASERRKLMQAEEEQRKLQMEQMRAMQAQQEQRAKALQDLAAQRPDLASLLQLAPDVGVSRAFPAAEKPQAYTLAPGQRRFEGGKEVAAVPAERKAPEGMQYDEGGRLVAIPGYVQMRSQIAAAGRQLPDTTPKAPPGYRYRQDMSLEAIPGGPADTKIGAEAEKQARRTEGAIQRSDVVLGKVREAINKSGVTTTGPLGAIAKSIPGTGAYNLKSTLDTIKANIGFAELQAMREASPTGGALGQVAVQELNALQAVLGSLDQAQSQDELLRNLYAIEKHYSNWKRAAQQGASQPVGAQKSDGGFKFLGRE